MAGSARLSKAKEPYGSQVDDDDIINRQLQADLNSQAEPYRTGSSTTVTKRKSRDVDEDCDAEERSPQKKRKEKDRERQKKKKEKRATKSLWDNRVDLSDDSSLSGADPVPKLENNSDRNGKKYQQSLELSSQDYTETHSADTNKGGKGKEAKDKIRPESGLDTVRSRTSLGLNKEALLKSILKGCSPAKSMEVKAEHALPSESEDENASAGPKISGTSKIPSKRRPRQRVSMVPVLPEGYKPNLSGSKGRFHCPIEVCDKVYTRRATLGEHMNTSHRGQKLRDNMDATMSIISREDYELAVSGGNDHNVFQIPDTPLPTKAANRTANEKRKEKAPSNSKVLRGGSVDSDVPESMEFRSPKASNLRDKSLHIEKQQTVHNSTPFEISQNKRGRSGYDSASNDNLSVIGEHSRQSRDFSTKSPQSKTSKPTKLVNPAVEMSTTESTKSHSGSSKDLQPGKTEDEMEDWETDPGLLAGSDLNSEDDSENEHDTAFSSFQTTGDGVKFRAIHFQVIRISPGSTSLSSDMDYVRICSVATGKVRVRVDGNQFSIGTHGMWRVRAGEKCTVANRHSSKAVVHITTIDLDD